MQLHHVRTTHLSVTYLSPSYPDGAYKSSFNRTVSIHGQEEAMRRYEWEKRGGHRGYIAHKMQ